MTAKKDDLSPKTEQGRREFLRASSIIAGGVILSRTTASAQPAQETTGIPLTTKLPDFPFLTAEEIAQLTPRARELTKRDLITLGRARANQEELAAEEMALDLTVQDINSIQQAFANYGVGRFEGLGGTQQSSVGCDPTCTCGPTCCTSCGCCCCCIPCCCASSVVKPVIKPVRVL
jgi:hypothetical protein